ncbi:MAG: hypothetical protein PWR31_1919 [Bacillota bacterium]|nr:hypothetical protein [Bacillota bacterium]
MAKDAFAAVGEAVRQAQDLARAGRAAEACTLLAEKLALYPENPYLTVTLARLYLKTHRLAEAAALLDEVLTAHPAYGPALMAQAEAKELTGELEEAERLFALAWQMRPTPYLLRRRVNLLLKLGRPEAARELCRAELEKDKGNATLYALLGRAEEMAGNLEDAAAAYQEAARLDPQNAFYRRRYLELKARLAGADALAETGRLLKAVHGRAAAEVHAWRAQELKRHQRFAEAAAEYEAAHALAPENNFYAEQLGFILHRLARYDEALPLLKAAAERRPEDQVVRSTLVKAFAAAGRAAEGAAFFTELVERYPHCRAIWGAVRRLEKAAGGENKK